MTHYHTAASLAKLIGLSTDDVMEGCRAGRIEPIAFAGDALRSIPLFSPDARTEWFGPKVAEETANEKWERYATGDHPVPQFLRSGFVATEVTRPFPGTLPGQEDRNGHGIPLLVSRVPNTERINHRPRCVACGGEVASNINLFCVSCFKGLPQSLKDTVYNNRLSKESRDAAVERAIAFLKEVRNA